MNTTEEMYQDEEMKASYIKWTLNQVTMLLQLQCRILAPKQTSSLPKVYWIFEGELWCCSKDVSNIWLNRCWFQWWWRWDRLFIWKLWQWSWLIVLWWNNKSFKNITELHNGTKLKALAYAKFRIFQLICPFRRLYSFRMLFEQNSKLLTYS